RAKHGLGRAPKVGNRYLRKLPVVGTHAVLYHRKQHEDALRSWAKKLMQTKPFKLVDVARAHKRARIAFPIMRGKDNVWHGFAVTAADIVSGQGLQRTTSGPTGDMTR